MATVYLRNKIWWARWYRPGGERVSKSTGLTGKRDARSKASEMEVEDRKARKGEGASQIAMLDIVERCALDATKGRLTPERAKEYIDEISAIVTPGFRSMTLAEMLPEWVGMQAEHVSADTMTLYRANVRRFLGASGKVADTPLREIDVAAVEKVFLKIREKFPKLKGTSLNREIDMLRRAFTWAVNRGYCPKNPAAEVRQFPETDSAKRVPFTTEEFRLLVDAGEDNEWRGFVLLAAHTGLRMGDLLKLSTETVEDGRITVTPSKTEKSDKTITIPLTPPCLGWIAGRSKGLLFPELAKLPQPTVSCHFKARMKAAGVPATVKLPGGRTGVRSFHSLRHTFTSWLADADVHADVRQKLTGHSSAGIHARYTHHDKALDRAIQSLPDVTSA